MGADSAPTGGEVQDQGGVENVGTDQSQGSVDHGLYDLSSVPEELRPYMEEQLREVTKRVDGKFREHAEYRKRFEPFEGIEGLTDVDPEDLQGLLQFNQILGDEDAFKSWLAAAIEETKFQQDLSEDDWAALGVENGWLEDDGALGSGDDTAGADQTQLLEQFKQLVEEQVAPLKEHLTTQQHEQVVADQRKELSDKLAALHEEHGEFDDDDVISLALRYSDQDDPIALAWDHFQRIRGNGQSDLLDEKTDQPGGSLPSGGQPDTSPKQFQSLDDPGLKEAARRRFAASR